MKNQKFEIRIVVGDDDEKVGVHMVVWKDGKLIDLSLLKAESLIQIYVVVKCALAAFSSRYLDKMKKQGVRSEGENSGIVN